MKRYIITYLSLISIAAITFFSNCSKQDFADHFYNPEKTVKTSMGGLYGGLLYNAGLDDHNTILPRYWNLFTFQVPMLGTYTQTIGFINDKGEYEQASNYVQDRWNYYYTGVMASYRELEKKYKTYIKEDEKKGYQLFMETARVFFYDQTAQMVDLFGAIPFTEAGQVNSSGGEIILGKYDKGKDIYDFILKDLKRISDYLATVNPDPFYAGQLKKFDFINGGDLLEWRKYCNSLRLRLAMRISNEDESMAKSIVQEILSNPTQYPLVNNNDENILIEAEDPSLGAITGVHEGGIRSGINSTPAPGYMLNDLMEPSADPRVQVFFSKNKNSEYKGLPTSWTATQQNSAITNDLISVYDSTTFVENNQFPGIIVSAAEVSFFKAEAFERWGGGDAKNTYETGIKQSIDFWYYVNNLNKNDDGFANFDPKTPPTDAEVTAFLSNPVIAYTGTKDQKLEKIATQLWIDYGLIRNYQGWAVIRRTGYPKLDFKPDPGSAQSPTPPSRLLYPVSERTLNEENHNAVKDQDNVNSKIFWDVN